jgi:serine/threonine-protein kinase
MNGRLGRFEIKEEIGRGGFGRVFLANDPIMNRAVAVKVLTATDDVDSLTRFRNEATSAGNLRHPNIVTVHEFGQEGHAPFLVMEYLEGRNLHDLITDRTPLSLYQKVRMMDQVADGLHFAHRHGVLHRDIKPANIMLLSDGTVKIMDFGIARFSGDSSPRLTQHGYLVGTVVYMAPELFSGAIVADALCDIWSYGVVMYELLGGENPFKTGSIQSEMYRVAHNDPAPLSAENCPAELEAVIKKLLARDRDLRYQSLEEVRFDLQPILKNLERAEADRLVVAAQELLFRRQLNEALEAARKARKMDPQNGTARVLFERIQEEQRKQSSQSRIDDLLRNANDAVEQKNLAEAIAQLNAAVRLDSSDERVQARLREVRNLKLKLEMADALISQAGAELNEGRLSEAFAHASEAVSHHPGNPDAQRLLESVQSAIDKREANRSLDAEIRRVRGKMAINDLEGALQMLRAAEEKYLARPDTTELADKITQMISDRKRSLECVRRLDQAKDLVRNSQLEEAIRELEQLLASFPDEHEATDLLAYAEHELKSQKRKDEVARIASAAADLTRERRYDEAIRVIEEGQKEFPDEISLSRLMRATFSELQTFARSTALEDGLKRCHELRQKGQLQDALSLVTLLGSDNPNHEELKSLEVTLKQEMASTERSSAIRNTIDQADKLLNEGQPERALSMVESAILRVGADPELASWQKKAKEARQAERERQSVEAELKHARLSEERGDIATSRKIIENALTRFPNSAELLAAKERLTPAEAPAEVKTETAPPAPSQVTPSPMPTASMPASPTPTASMPAPHAPRRDDEDGAPKGSRWRLFATVAAAVAGVTGVVVLMLPSNVSITPDKLSFAGANPQGQTVTVAGSKEVADPKPTENWIHFARHISSSGKTEFEVTAVTTGLTPGRHTGDLVFGAKKVEVDLTVPPHLFDLRPASLVFSSAAGAIAPQKVAVTSRSNIPNPTPSEKWVTVARRGSGPGKAEFEVAVVATGLTPGPHTAFLQFSPDEKLPVQLMIPGGSTLDVYPTFLAFPGGGAQQKVIVTGPGDLPEPKPTEPWVTFQRTSVGPGKAEYVVQVSADKLEQGKKYAHLVFSPEKKVQIELTVAGPALDLQPDSLAFPGGGAQQTITVTGPPTIPDPASTDPWLTFTRHDDGPGKAEFTVQANSNGLVPGPHIAYLTFDPTKQVRVELTVSPPKPLEVQPAELRFKYSRGGALPPQTVTASGPVDIPDPTKKAPWIQVTRNNGAAKTDFVVQILPDKLGPDSNSDDLVFSPQKKVRINVAVADAPEAAPAASGTLFWSGGTLNPGDELWIKDKRVLKGPGAASGGLPKAEIKMDRSKFPASMRVIEEPSPENGFVLRLGLTSGPPVYYLSIPWTLKK